jgi:biopolymer transport protein ExbD
MKKDAISLIEVLISIMLISVVVVSLLQIKENNLYFLTKTKDMAKYNSYVSMVALDINKDGNIYLDKKVDFKDDDIRRQLKEIKIKVKNKDFDNLQLGSYEYSIAVNINETKFNIEDKVDRTFYRFSISN